MNNLTLKPSEQQFCYYPRLDKIPRDLSHNHGSENNWGKQNKLIINWADAPKAMIYSSIEDPNNSDPAADMLLWVFPDRVVFSQLSSKMSEVYPNN